MGLAFLHNYSVQRHFSLTSMLGNFPLLDELVNLMNNSKASLSLLRDDRWLSNGEIGTKANGFSMANQDSSGPGHFIF